MSRIAACLLLVFLSAPVAARDIRLQGANGDGGRCPEVAAAADEAGGTNGKPHASNPAQAPRIKATKPVSAHGESDSARIPAPRWHSFLPGMFR